MQTTDYFIHPLADNQSETIGSGTKVWQFTVILPGARIGSDCNICSHVFIENDVIVGDRVTIKNGVQLWDGLRMANDVFIGPNVTFTNDKFPRSKHYPEQFPMIYIDKSASIGGGGDNTTKYQDWQVCNDWGGCCRHQGCATLRSGSRQSGTGNSVSGGGR